MSAGRIPTTANSPLTTKGDLFGYSTQPARLAVGANGDTIVADSSTSTGLRWQSTYEAGSNFLINGGMDIWQRGTTFTSGAFDPKYTSDRWLQFVATGSNTITQETSTLPTGARFACKWTSGAAGGTFGFYQTIETANVIPLAGKVVTIQVQVTGTTGKTAYIQFNSSTGVDTAPLSVNDAIANSANVTLTSGTYTTITLTATVPANAKTLRVGIVSVATFANTEGVTFGNCKLEVGSVATAFTRAGGNIQGELAACQRYYYRQSGTTDGGNFNVTGIGSSTTNVSGVFQVPVTMRVKPSSVDFSLVGVTDTASASPASNITVSGFGSNDKAVVLNITASGLTQFRPYAAQQFGSGTGHIGVSAEL